MQEGGSARGWGVGVQGAREAGGQQTTVAPARLGTQDRADLGGRARSGSRAPPLAAAHFPTAGTLRPPAAAPARGQVRTLFVSGKGERALPRGRGQRREPAEAGREAAAGGGMLFAEGRLGEGVAGAPRSACGRARGERSGKGALGQGFCDRGESEGRT